MIRLSGQRFARFIKKLENGELRLISDEFWLTIPFDDARLAPPPTARRLAADG